MPKSAPSLPSYRSRILKQQQLRLELLLRSVQSVLGLLKERKKLTVSEWADQNRVLSQEGSAEYGKWFTSRAEYQRGIQDAFNDPRTHTVAVMSSAQIGKTEVMANVLGYHVDQDPCPILIVEPTLEVGDTYSKDRLSPMIRDTPCLAAKIKEKSRDDENTIRHKKFLGGHISITGANAPASLRARPIRIVLCDDVDAFPPSAGSEGDPVDLAAKRTTTFWNRKIGMFSTPDIKGTSRIERAYNKSDQRRYYVPCPKCGYFQVLEWEQVKWPKGEPEKVCYECIECKAQLNDVDRLRMVRHGEWRAQEPFRGIAGFWINEIYSPWVSMAEMVARWYAAQGNVESLKVFVNTSLARPWEQVIVKKEESELKKSMCQLPAQVVPADAVALTCGIDMQLAGFWFVVRAWAVGNLGLTGWNIHYGYLPTWESLEGLLFGSAYRKEDGTSLPIWRAAIDTGGGGKFENMSMTEEAYWWIIRNMGRGVQLFGTKGASNPIPGKFKLGEQLLQAPSGKKLPQWFRLVLIDTGAMKDMLHYGLEIAAKAEGGTGALYLHSETEETYFRQILAEEKREDPKTRVQEWVQVRKDNHLLDADCLSVALAQPQWFGGGVNLIANLMNKTSNETKPRPAADKKQKRRLW